MKITDHKLPEGIALTFRVPEGNIKHPLILLCHGFCGIRNVLLPSFANAFTEAGFATITFDYRGFGESEGERGRLVPAMQTEDIISVINWAEKQVCIDNQRIGLWGTSLGGCHVFNAAAQDKRVKSIVSQLAFADGEVLVTGEMNELEKASFLSTLNKMAEKKKNTGKEMFVGVTRVLSDNESKVFFEKVKGQYPEMDIKIPFLTVMETLQYKPAESAAKVQCPVWLLLPARIALIHRNREEPYMMLLLLVLRNYTRKLTHAIMIFIKARFLNVWRQYRRNGLKNIFNCRY